MRWAKPSNRGLHVDDDYVITNEKDRFSVDVHASLIQLASYMVSCICVCCQERDDDAEVVVVWRMVEARSAHIEE